jgi:hypothetical protein
MAYQQQPYRPYPPQNGLGTGGFVCGVVAVTIGIVPILGAVGIPVALCGIGLSAVGMSRTTQGLANNRGMAVAGLVLSITAIPLVFVWTYLLLGHH